MPECRECGADSWTEVYKTAYSGHKGTDDRSPTRKSIFKCDGCGAEGRRFEDGPTGEITFSGAMADA